MNARTYCAYKNKLMTTPFVIEDGKGFYVLDGQRIPMKEFESAYPLPSKIPTQAVAHRYKGQNIDSTRAWMED